MDMEQMERYIAYMRENYRDVFNVNEIDDLPLILLTEVINQSVLRGANKISITYDGKVICVKDNARPYEYRSLSGVVSVSSVGMVDPIQRRYYRIMDRQWNRNTMATVNALCTDFTLISSEGEKMQSVICKDGLVVSDKEGNISIGNGNMVIMRAFRGADLIEAKHIEMLMEYIGYHLPQIQFQYIGK